MGQWVKVNIFLYYLYIVMFATADLFFDHYPVLLFPFILFLMFGPMIANTVVYVFLESFQMKLLYGGILCI